MVCNEDNIPYSILLEDVYEFVVKELPSEYGLKKIYEYNFVLNEMAGNFQKWGCVTYDDKPVRVCLMVARNKDNKDIKNN